VIFPFEPPLYAAEDLQVSYVGNPLLDEYAGAQPLPDLRAESGLSKEVPLVGIFPGSRRSELKYSFETLVESAALILAKKPQTRFIIPIAPSLDPELIRQRLAGCPLPITLSQESIYAVASACDAVLCVSGTVTLQTALCRTPMAVLYKAATLSYLVGSLLVKIPHFSLVNIVAETEVVREFLQHQANPQALSAEILRLLEDQDYRGSVKKGLEAVCKKLGEPGTSRRVALMAAAICHRKDTIEKS
jgi:lipid-A-disaccharide synthase